MYTHVLAHHANCTAGSIKDTYLQNFLWFCKDALAEKAALQMHVCLLRPEWPSTWSEKALKEYEMQRELGIRSYN